MHCCWLHPPSSERGSLKLIYYPLKKDIQLCSFVDLQDDGDKDQNDSQDWLLLIDQGGLTRVNITTFEMFMAMEYKLHQHIYQGQSPNKIKSTSYLQSLKK